MSSENTFEYAEKISVRELSEHLSKLAKGFRGKSLELQGKGQTLELKPEEIVKLEVKAKSKEHEGELELEVSWKYEEITPQDKLEVSPGLPEESGPQ